MVDIAALKAKNAQRWSVMHLSAQRLASFDATARRLCSIEAKTIYRQISAATGVPWWVIAVIHEREAGGPPHWDKQLGQGDPLDQVSRHDPKGRGPFTGPNAFYNAAVDALTNCSPYAARWKDWSIGGALTLLEEYNGLGYAAMGIPSAYVWSGTDQYVSGKYVADHVFRSDVVDVQEGCAPIISRMMALDTSISTTIPSFTAPQKPAPVVVPTPQQAPPPIVVGTQIRQNWVTTLINAILAIFKKR